MVRVTVAAVLGADDAGCAIWADATAVTRTMARDKFFTGSQSGGLRRSDVRDHVRAKRKAGQG